MTLSARIRDFLDAGALAAQHIGGTARPGPSAAVKIAAAATLAAGLGGCSSAVDGTSHTVQIAEVIHGEGTRIAIIDRSADKLCTGTHSPVPGYRQVQGDLICRQLSALPADEREAVEAAVAARPAIPARGERSFGVLTLHYTAGGPVTFETAYDPATGRVCNALRTYGALPSIQDSARKPVSPADGPRQEVYSTGTMKMRGASFSCYALADAPAAERTRLRALTATGPRPAM